MSNILADLVVNLDANLSDLNAKFRQLDSDLMKAADGFDAIGSRFTGLGATMSVALTAPLVAVAGLSIKAAGSLEQTEIAFTTMLGSAEAAKSMLADLKEFAAKTPFEFPELIEAAKRLKAFGFEADQIIPVLRIVGDTVAALGGGSDKINRITLALGQMQAKGKVSAEEMRQLAESTVPAWEILADAIGVSMAEAMKMAEDGAISAATAVPAILEGLNARFGGIMALQARTFLGKWSDFKDKLFFILQDIGKALLPVAGQALEQLRDVAKFVGELTKKFSELDPFTQKVILGFVGFVAVAGPALVITGQLIAAIGNVSQALGVLGPMLGKLDFSVLTRGFSSLAGMLPGLVSGLGSGAGFMGILSSLGGVITKFSGVLLAGLTSPVGIAVAAVAALAAVGYLLYTNWEDVCNVLSALWTDLTNLANKAFGGLKEFFGGVWDGIVEAFQSVWEGIKDWLGEAWSGIAALASAVWTPVANFFATIWNAVSGFFTSAWQAISDYLAGVWDWIKAKAEAVWNGIVKVFKGALDWLSKAFPETAKAIREWGKESEESGKKTEELAKQTKGTIKPVLELGKGVKGLTDEEKAWKKAVDEIIKANKEAAERVAKQRTEIFELSLKTIEARKALELFNAGLIVLERNLDGSVKSTYDFIEGANDLARQIDEVERATQDLSKSVPAMTRAMEAALKPVPTEIDKVTEAFKRQNINSSADLAQLARNAEEDYHTIANSASKDYYAIQQAWVNMLEAQKQASKRGVADWTEDQEARLQAAKNGLDAMDGATNTSVSNQKTTWGKLGTQISTIFTDMSKNIADAIWSGESLLDVFTDVFTEIGKAVTRFVVEYLEGKLFKALASLIDDLLPSVSKLFKDIFGTASDVAKTTGSPANVSASASGGGDALSAITGIVTSISSVISAIYDMRQEGTLNAIEKNTRYCQIGITEAGGLIEICWGIQDILWHLYDVLWNNMHTRLEEIRDAVRTWTGDVTVSTTSATTAASEVTLDTGELVAVIEQCASLLESTILSVGDTLTGALADISTALNTGETVVVSTAAAETTTTSGLDVVIKDAADVLRLMLLNIRNELITVNTTLAAQVANLTSKTGALTAVTLPAEIGGEANSTALTSTTAEFGSLKAIAEALSTVGSQVLAAITAATQTVIDTAGGLFNSLENNLQVGWETLTEAFYTALASLDQLVLSVADLPSQLVFATTSNAGVIEAVRNDLREYAATYEERSGESLRLQASNATILSELAEYLKKGSNLRLENKVVLPDGRVLAEVVTEYLNQTVG
ncbi:MAG: tape measure protein [Bryobacteraceae bacterium]